MNLRRATGRPGVVLSVVGAAIIAGVAYCVGAGDCSLWSPDRNGYRAFAQGDFADAAALFADTDWRAAALFRQGEFERAAGIWSGSDTAESVFNHGNALVMLGRYEEAAERYSRALEERPDWTAARENRAIALSRARALEREGGDMTGGMLGADGIVFSPSANSAPADGGSEPVEAGAGDAAMREVWLRQVQTRPADFLRSKFAYQYARRDAGGD